MPMRDAMGGEPLSVPDRVVVAPAAGVFEPEPIDVGATLDAGAIVGRVRAPGAEHEVRSPFGGTLMAQLARKGERVRPGQPVAWLLLGAV
jgi:biotin carboxyl carrier protein